MVPQHLRCARRERREGARCRGCQSLGGAAGCVSDDGSGPAATVVMAASIPLQTALAKQSGTAVKPFPIFYCGFCRPMNCDRRGLADANINRSPRPSSRRDMDPRPGGTVIPVAQENPFAMKEATETEMAAVFEKVAAHNAAVVSIEIVVPIGAVKQTSVAILVAKAVAIPIAKT